MIKAQQLALAIGAHRRRARFTGEQRHLAETGSAFQGGNPHLLTLVLAADKNSKRPLGNKVEAVALLPLFARRLVLREIHPIEIRRELGQRHAINAREQIGLRQEFRGSIPAAIFLGVPDWCCRRWRSHCVSR